MPRWFDRWVDRTVERLGYTKAAREPRVDISSVFGGEAPLGASELLASTDDARQIQNERLAVTSSWVFSDIRVVANEGSQAKMGVHEVKGEGTEEVVDHEFERLMRQPNPHWSGMLLKQYTLWWWLLRGEAYWLKVFDRTGALRQIWPLPSSRMRPIPDERKYISGYRYTPSNSSKRDIPFLPQQVVFFRFPNPFDYHRGLSPLSAYIRAMQSDIKAADWNLDTFDKEVTLKTLLSLRPELSKPQYETAKAEILEQLIQKQMRYMVARGGDLDVKHLSLSPKEAEYLASREMSRDEIDRVFGFPEGYWSARANRCYSEDTQALTADGWKHYWELSFNDKIACYDCDAGELKYHHPTDIYINEDYDGDMIHFSSRVVDVLVTPTHRMLYRTRYWGEKQADEIDHLKWVQFHAVPEHYEGQEVSTFILPGVEHLNNAEGEQDIECSMDDWLEFLGYFISEGGLSTKPCAQGGDRLGNRQRYLFTMSQKPGEIAEKIEALFSRLPFHHSAYNGRGDICRWTVSHKALWSWLRDNVGGHCGDKRIPRMIFDMNLSRRQLRILWEALIDGDGTRDNQPNHLGGAYYTSSSRLVDDIQELAVRLGIRSQVCGPYYKHHSSNYVSKWWAVRWVERNYAQAGLMEHEPYDGAVWCVTVPTGWLVTRRNNKITIQGNSNSEQAKAALIDSVIWPLLQLMAADVTAQLIVPEYGEQYIVQFNDIRIVDRRLQLAERNVHWRGKTFNEAREDLNLDPYDGPMAETIGLLPMPLAIAPQFILSLQGIEVQQLGGVGGPPAQLPPGQQGAQQKAIKEDLRRWRGIALRRLRDGEDPASYDFESETIPGALMQSIKAALLEATDEEAVKAAFEYSDNGGKEVRAASAATFRGRQWEGYP